MDTVVTLRMIALVMYVSCFIYWKISETKADSEKKKTVETTNSTTVRVWFTYVLYGFTVLQLLGLTILPFRSNDFLTILGFVLICLGAITSVYARYILGTNWAHGGEYQIKQNQELVTKSIYKYIRHPIYTGMSLMLIGVQLLTNSYLLFIYLACIPFIIFKQARAEELLLTKHFGDKYKTYRGASKMFIPFVW